MSPPSPTLTLILIQTVILAIVASVVFFVLWRRAVKKTKTVYVQETEHTSSARQETSADDDDDDDDDDGYLEKEHALSKYHIETILYSDEDSASGTAISDRMLLQLRADYLSIEKKYAAKSAKRDDIYWKVLINDVKDLLRQHDMFSVIQSKARNKEDTGLPAQLARLDENGRQLEELIETDASPADISTQLKNIAEMLTSIHAEVSEGISVLENENDFLREQVQELINQS